MNFHFIALLNQINSNEEPFPSFSLYFAKGKVEEIFEFRSAYHFLKLHERLLKYNMIFKPENALSLRVLLIKPMDN